MRETKSPDSERLSSLPEDTQLISSRVGFEPSLFEREPKLFPSSVLFLSHTLSHPGPHTQ